MGHVDVVQDVGHVDVVQEVTVLVCVLREYLSDYAQAWFEPIGLLRTVDPKRSLLFFQSLPVNAG